MTNYLHLWFFLFYYLSKCGNNLNVLKLKIKEAEMMDSHILSYILQIILLCCLTPLRLRFG